MIISWAGQCFLMGIRNDYKLGWAMLPEGNKEWIMNGLGKLPE